MKATALDRLLASASQAIGKRRRGRIAGVVPGFMPERNSELIGNADRVKAATATTVTHTQVSEAVTV